MNVEENVGVVKDWFAAMGSDMQRLSALSDNDIEGSFRAKTGRWRARTADTPDWYPEPPEYVAQGERIFVVGHATGRVKATNETFEEYWVFAITVRNGRLTKIREYVDTQAMARASAS